MASARKTKKREKSSINYRLTPSRTQSFRPDKFELKRVKPENKSSENHRVTTSQLATTLAGIWSYIRQPPVLKSDENLNFEICQENDAIQCANQISTYEKVRAMKKKLLFSYFKMANVDVLWDKRAYMGCQYVRAICEPKYLSTTRILCNGNRNYCTIQTTEDPPCGDGDVNGSEQTVSQKEEEAMVVLENKASDQELEYKIEFLTSHACVNTQKESLESSFSTVSKSSMDKFIEKDYGGGSDSLQENLDNCQFFVQDRVKSVIYVNRHALAGALAGTTVSLCLHPVDTIKTIVQSRGAGGFSFYQILRQTLTERGLLGLYRGIASNIASSAPISAIYTFTYESVKGSLLPIFPKEHQSVTHCIAGGCSSVATSVIFTPSEQIKQQMQVGTQYKNCWNALVGCIEKGGVATLYAGWRAVLCRNIPHSIIKFYTYERLKRFILEGRPDSTFSSWQTLACGGLAGSTAALFTTPFDVVKTRIQTQAPGTERKYNGVLQALKEIMKTEGLPGLYRGLTPRLGMYISQGSIFFASYEFLKALFALDVQKQSSKPESGRNDNPPLCNS